MSEDNTQKQTDGEKLILERIAKLEAQATNTTRPLLDQLIREMIQTREMLMERIDIVEKTLTARIDEMNASLEGVEKELSAINHRLDVFSLVSFLRCARGY